MAGLFNSILLSRSGFKVILFEKKQYPFHRVCGEYISNEVLPFLEKQDLFPAHLEPSRIDRLIISSSSGSQFSTPLDLGGFGVSRFAYDHWLAQKAMASGVELLENTTVQDIQFQGDQFNLTTSLGTEYTSKLVIGAHGKRTKLDKQLNRNFIRDHSPYVGVKYHLKTDSPSDTIALHNFTGGYCGISKVEDDTYNLCYLIHRDQIRKHGSIEQTEKNVLQKNPHLNHLMTNSDFLFDKPEVINEVSFKAKEAVYQKILMTGDSAGTITPLSGNGMAMAIRSAHLLSQQIISNYSNGQIDLDKVICGYTTAWDVQFKRPMWIGRKIQWMYFGNPLASHIAVLTGKIAKPIAKVMIKQTHGEPFS